MLLCVLLSPFGLLCVLCSLYRRLQQRSMWLSSCNMLWLFHLGWVPWQWWVSMWSLGCSFWSVNLQSSSPGCLHVHVSVIALQSLLIALTWVPLTVMGGQSCMFRCLSLFVCSLDLNPILLLFVEVRLGGTSGGLLVHTPAWSRINVEIRPW